MAQHSTNSCARPATRWLAECRPAISGRTLVVNSGYVQNGMPGNVLLAFTVDGK